MRLDTKRGLTLTEMMIAVAIVAVLALMLVPAGKVARQRYQNGDTAQLLRRAVQAFELYHMDNGSYPADKTPGQVPPGMQPYFDRCKVDWGTAPAVGGSWDWDQGYGGGKRYAVAISAPDADDEQMELLDRLVDDGNLASGFFRKHAGNYQFIVADEDIGIGD